MMQYSTALIKGESMSSRRRFLQYASTAGLVLSAQSLFGRLVSAQTPATVDQTARILINSRRTIATLDRNLSVHFLSTSDEQSTKVSTILHDHSVGRVRSLSFAFG